MSGAGGGSPSNRQWGELAAVVSAIAAVTGLLMAAFGVPFVGGSPVNRNIAEGAAAPQAPAPSASAAQTYASGPPARTAEPGTVPTTSAAPSSPPALPKGWRRVDEAALTVTFAVPDGWTQEVANEIQRTWQSPDQTHKMSVKRDTSYGSTPRAASAGQLAWYRNSGESSMTGIEVATHTTRQNGRDALWLEIDYHWVGQSEPRKRVEVFVAGEAGHVYQLLLDTAAVPASLAEQRRMFATARAQLLIDR